MRGASAPLFYLKKWDRPFETAPILFVTDTFLWRQNGFYNSKILAWLSVSYSTSFFPYAKDVEIYEDVIHLRDGSYGPIEINWAGTAWLKKVQITWKIWPQR